jgi:predicted MFS family arabinose efflux permease
MRALLTITIAVARIVAIERSDDCIGWVISGCALSFAIGAPRVGFVAYKR